jgi:hypothetical protein
MSGREVLHHLGRQAVRLVEHVEGLARRRQHAASLHVQRRQDEVVVCDHQVRLLRTLACGVERAADKLKASIA